MRVGFHHMTATLMAGTLAVGLPMESEQVREMNLAISASTGSYACVSRGCDGTVRSARRIPIQEKDVAFDIAVNREMRIGIIGSHVRWGPDPEWGERQTDVEAHVVNPYVSIEHEPISFGFGVAATRGKLPRMDDNAACPTWYLRIGRRRSGYVELRRMQAVPQVTAGSVQVRGGADPGNGFGVWVGVGGFPHDRLGFMIGADIRLAPRFHLDLLGRLGSSEGVPESSISCGVRYRR